MGWGGEALGNARKRNVVMGRDAIINPYIRVNVCVLAAKVARSRDEPFIPQFGPIILLRISPKIHRLFFKNWPIILNNSTIILV